MLFTKLEEVLGKCCLKSWLYRLRQNWRQHFPSRNRLSLVNTCNLVIFPFYIFTFSEGFSLFGGGFSLRSRYSKIQDRSWADQNASFHRIVDLGKNNAGHYKPLAHHVKMAILGTTSKFRHSTERITNNVQMCTQFWWKYGKLHVSFKRNKQKLTWSAICICKDVEWTLLCLRCENAMQEVSCHLSKQTPRNATGISNQIAEWNAGYVCRTWEYTCPKILGLWVWVVVLRAHHLWITHKFNNISMMHNYYYSQHMPCQNT